MWYAFSLQSNYVLVLFVTCRSEFKIYSPHITQAALSVFSYQRGYIYSSNMVSWAACRAISILAQSVVFVDTNECEKKLKHQCFCYCRMLSVFLAKHLFSHQSQRPLDDLKSAALQDTNRHVRHACSVTFSECNSSVHSQSLARTPSLPGSHRKQVNVFRQRRNKYFNCFFPFSTAVTK